MKSVYIAGRSGTSGLLLHEVLQKREDIRLLAPEVQGRDALDRETELLNTADVAILCLPSAAGKKALARITNPTVRVIDTSTTHSVADGWVYGLPELKHGQRDAIRQARRVSGPGCFATGFILALRPLVDCGIVDPATPICVQGIGGYSAGGKRLVEWYEQPEGEAPPQVQVFGLNLEHAQVPEMQQHTGLQRPPLFVPWVGNFHRGMLVSIPLHRDWLRTNASPASVRDVLRDRYAAERLVSIKTRGGLLGSVALSQPLGIGVELFVEGNNDHLLLLARLDNLRKGSAIAAIQNMNLLLGCDEFAGIEENACGG
ncbi:MAG: N-acetyl-gamma-glutamyl-phosphate reductase [Planctomycetaceae bacterium]|nr:N-acetyl-gamma-glutamyl-phosphate reductase [Planctomycetaceae bacterium]